MYVLAYEMNILQLNQFQHKVVIFIWQILLKTEVSNMHLVEQL